jgi:hypothetical protein
VSAATSPRAVSPALRAVSDPPTAALPLAHAWQAPAGIPRVGLPSAPSVPMSRPYAAPSAPSSVPSSRPLGGHFPSPMSPQDSNTFPSGAPPTQPSAPAAHNGSPDLPVAFSLPLPPVSTVFPLPVRPSPPAVSVLPPASSHPVALLTGWGHPNAYQLSPRPLSAGWPATPPPVVPTARTTPPVTTQELKPRPVDISVSTPSPRAVVRESFPISGVDATALSPPRTTRRSSQKGSPATIAGALVRSWIHAQKASGVHDGIPPPVENALLKELDVSVFSLLELVDGLGVEKVLRDHQMEASIDRILSDMDDMEIPRAFTEEIGTEDDEEGATRASRSNKSSFAW